MPSRTRASLHSVFGEMRLSMIRRAGALGLPLSEPGEAVANEMLLLALAGAMVVASPVSPQVSLTVAVDGPPAPHSAHLLQ
jgi:hypothetical protein